ncbi:25S rRNA (adenine645-N1)-methyltransferase [Rhizophlyctis rosea]|nr:25S rRNA (adenine645-N1)-methyltransferase [Rhizophlyctis rosea]
MKRKRNAPAGNKTESDAAAKSKDSGDVAAPTVKQLKQESVDKVGPPATSSIAAAPKKKSGGIDKARLKKLLNKPKPQPPAKPAQPPTPSPLQNPKPPKNQPVQPPIASSKTVKPNPSAKATNAMSTLQQQMHKKLAGSKFRWINELLYTKQSNEAVKLFSEQPEMFEIYHEGFRSQVESWPTNPIDIFIDYLRHQPTDTVVADMGCGEGKIAQTLHDRMQIHSFDLAAPNEHIVACDIANVPLEDSSVDITIFCLSLMGTNYMDFVKEAHRILKPGGKLKIAEVISRFPNVDRFIQVLESVGFKFLKKDDSNKMFILFNFVKGSGAKAKVGPKTVQKAKGKNGQKANDKADDAGSGEMLLKPCIYKRR